MPRWLAQFRLVLRSLFRRRRVDQELDEELQYHLEREVDEGLKSGLALQEARACSHCCRLAWRRVELRALPQAPRVGDGVIVESV